ncbi:MAG: UDP-glucose 4-epimerase GalE [Chloroflexi bacterium]|nr:UDP-glucose 4-epimerase GalE [Chloroflexota bacterium]
MRVLVTGGAGYVGSVSVEGLLRAGHTVTVLDTLVTGHRAAVAPGAELVVGTLSDASLVAGLLRSKGIEAVVHCGARSLVGESIANPALYYRENVAGGVALLEALREVGVDRLVFSSSAAVYGAPDSAAVDETAVLRPINPYGETKRAFEGALTWYGRGHGLRAVALRYFNVAGASQAFGEHHQPETHLIPNVLAGAAGGTPVTIMGTDYPTPDGTPVRDYIHVEDLSDAHLAALELTAAAPPGLEVCNLGSGSGFSVWEVLRAAQEAVGAPIPHEVGARRAGDPPVLVATNDRARDVLGWTPRRGTLQEMIGSAWRWRQAHPQGYAEG